MTARRRFDDLAGALFVALIAGCQPLPHPFADDRPPKALLKVPDSIDVAVGTFEGEPRATAAKLGAAIAKELIKHDIPASERTASRTSYRLDGRIEESPPQQNKATVTVFWRLRDPAGRIVDERSDRASAPVREWEDGNDERVAALAASGVDALAGLLTDETPTEKPMAGGADAGSGRIRVAVRKVSGAPGDGDTSLALSVATVLKRHDLDIVDPKTGKPDLAVDAEIKVEPAKDGKQHVKIVWRVARLAGGEVGTVAQENDIPRGQLDGAWGDIAYSVAIAAEGGLTELIDRGAPPLKLGAAPPPPAAPPPVPPMPTRPADAAAPPPAATSPSAAPLLEPPPPLLPMTRGVPLPSR
jgi:hypothetical protein